MFFDTHCHIHMERFAGEEAALIERMRAAQVSRAVVVATDVDEIAQVQTLLDRYPELYGAFALSPQDETLTDLSAEAIAQYVQGDRWVAVGETGIDYHYCTEPLDWARNRFATHIAAARLAQKPLVIHSRDAADDTIAILRENGADEAGFVLHCFCGDWDFARRALDLGAYLSFSGIVTFKTALDQQDVARRAPMDRILIETDSPYLAPVPLRGKRNEPSFVPHVANYLAQLRGMTLEDVARQTTQNALRFFKIKGK